jgi:hypothetical protein
MHLTLSVRDGPVHDRVMRSQPPTDHLRRARVRSVAGSVDASRAWDQRVPATSPTFPMNYEIDFGGGLQDVTVTARGVVDLATLVQLPSELVHDARFRRNMTILVDHSELAADAITTAGVRAVADAWKEHYELIGEATIALVAGRPLTYGLGRMWQAYTAAAPFRSRVFYTRDDALAWLSEGAPDEVEAAGR